MRAIHWTLRVATGMALALSLAANAADDKSGEWAYELAPLYLWGMSIDGTSRIGPVTTPLDVKFKDAVSDLSAVFTFHFEGKNPRWGYYLDLSYDKLTPESKLPTGQ